MGLYLVCYEQVSGSMAPADFTAMLNEKWAVQRILGAAWLLRDGSHSASQVGDVIAAELAERGDQNVEGRYLFVAKIEGHDIGWIKTYVEDYPLSDWAKTL